MTCPPFLAPGRTYDPDQAACALAVSLGLYRLPPGDRTFGPAKWVFASANPVGDAVSGLLDALTAVGVLVRDADGYRLADGYDPARFGDWGTL